MFPAASACQYRWCMTAGFACGSSHESAKIKIRSMACDYERIKIVASCFARMHKAMFVA